MRLEPKTYGLTASSHNKEQIGLQNLQNYLKKKFMEDVHEVSPKSY
jgi:hypothetical protein